MSDLGWCLVDLAAPPGEAESRADRVRHWLLYEQVVIPNPMRDDLWQPSELAPGRLVVGEGVDDEFLRVADNGVDVDAGRAVHGKAGASAPSCARCGCALGVEEHRVLVEAWDDSGKEPAATCTTCGTTAPLSAWVGEGVALCGAMPSPSTTGPARARRSCSPPGTGSGHVLGSPPRGDPLELRSRRRRRSAFNRSSSASSMTSRALEPPLR